MPLIPETPAIPAAAFSKASRFLGLTVQLATGPLGAILLYLTAVLAIIAGILGELPSIEKLRS